MKTSCHILGMGTYVPSRILTNADLTTFVETTDEWITSRTGISQRHVLAEGENTSDAGLAAARAALAEAGMQPDELTHVFAATCTPDKLCPSVACMVAGKLDCGQVMALDFNAACSGFLYGLSLARGILSAEPQAKVLLLCAEGLTRRVNWQDRSTCVLFGDGAGAVILSGADSAAQPGIGILEDVTCTSDGSLQHLITIGGGTAQSYKPGDPVDESFFIQMQGREVFKHAVRSMTSICLDLLKKNGLSIQDVDVLVPHQANMRIIEAVGSRLEISADHVFTNVQNYGNTSSASVPIALGDARAQGRIGEGSLVLMTSFGSGLTWGAALIRF